MNATSLSGREPSEAEVRERPEDRLAQLYRQHATAALRLAFLLSGDRDAAQDIVQDAFMRVSGRLGSLRQPERFGGYLYRTVLNLSRSYGRRQRRESPVLEGQAREATDVVEMPDLDTRDVMWRALMGVPLRQRAVLFFRFYEDLSEAQVADVLQCSVGAVKVLAAACARQAPGRYEE